MRCGFVWMGADRQLDVGCVILARFHAQPRDQTARLYVCGVPKRGLQLVPFPGREVLAKKRVPDDGELARRASRERLG